MDFFGGYRSPFGYENGEDGGVDSYGVDHSGFNTQDELQYQTLRVNRESEMAEDLGRSGVAEENYPQYGLSFWQNAGSSGAGGLDMASLSPTVQAALNLAKRYPAQNQQSLEQKNNSWDTIKRWGDNFADGTQAAAVGYTTGLTLGNFDEAMGGATALLTGNQDNYTKGRDATRQLQNDLSQRHPYLYGGAEFLGAVQSPLQLFRGAKKMDNVLNAITNTAAASAGYAENWRDFGSNLLANGAGNAIGVKMNQLPFFRAAGVSARKALTQGVNCVTGKIVDSLEDN